eukprot:5756935-Prorocentrum_lima.AAC.1
MELQLMLEPSCCKICSGKRGEFSCNTTSARIDLIMKGHTRHGNADSWIHFLWPQMAQCAVH